jgi:hypothetical protein
LENGLWGSSALSKFSPEELEAVLVLADCPDWEEKEMKQGGFRQEGEKELVWSGRMKAGYQKR